MKISNEAKVGTLTAIAITLLILGFNFLKGRSIFKTGYFLYAKYPDAKGLMISNPVYINGYQVGSVFDIENEDDNLKNIIVAIKLKSSYNIPVNSVASIKENPLGAPSIRIRLGNDTKFLQSGDSLITASSAGLLGEIGNKLSPIGDQLKVTLVSLDSTLRNISSIFNPNTKHNLQEVIVNINKTTASLAVSSVAIQQMLDKQSGAIAQTMNNVNSFTKNLADNNEKITKTVGNVEAATDKLAKSDLNGTVSQLKASIEKLNNILGKLNSTDGSIGLLMNDKTLYNNLTNTVRSANILMDDLRTHPKRYVNISVFGRKDRTGPLLAPLHDSTKQQPK